MSDLPIIEARDLGKTYVTHRSGVTSLKETIVRNYFRRGERIEHHALSGVHFSVPRGSSFAVVGGNGSGKSTLLRLIAGITEPTSGTLEVRGRVAAMIELGAGFHPDLTGMENIFLQCSIQGMPRERIFGKLDAILDFAELGEFIHTPVKRYSTGMLVRLGFSIAWHSDADIILLDEILAVGDGYFQAKTMRAIESLRDQGKTIFFVSHTLEQVEAVADHVLWLEQGRMRMIGDAEEVLDAVFDHTQDAVRRVSTAAAAQSREAVNVRSSIAFPSIQTEGREARILAVRFFAADGTENRRLSCDEAFTIEVRYEVLQPLPAPLSLNISFGSAGGMHALHVEQRDGLSGEPGIYTARMAFDRATVHAGRYAVTVSLADATDASKWFDLHLRLYTLTFREPGSRIGHFDMTMTRPPGAFGE